MPSSGFQFKQFYIAHDTCAHKVGTDGVLIGAWAKFEQSESILDIGSGSGLISLLCAQRFAEAEIVGVELDKMALNQACKNAAKSNFHNQIQFIHDDVLLHNFTQKFDAIISNPPFFEGATSTGKVLRDQARTTSSLPLIDLAKRVTQLLYPNGSFALILPKLEAQQFLIYAEAELLYLQRLCKVRGATNAEDKRWMLQLGFTKKESVPTETLCLRNANNERSSEYAELTKDFYL